MAGIGPAPVIPMESAFEIIDCVNTIKQKNILTVTDKYWYEIVFSSIFKKKSTYVPSITTFNRILNYNKNKYNSTNYYNKNLKYNYIEQIKNNYPSDSSLIRRTYITEGFIDFLEKYKQSGLEVSKIAEIDQIILNWKSQVYWWNEKYKNTFSNNNQTINNTQTINNNQIITEQQLKDINEIINKNLDKKEFKQAELIWNLLDTLDEKIQVIVLCKFLLKNNKINILKFYDKDLEFNKKLVQFLNNL